jgi:hypothetical protein
VKLSGSAIELQYRQVFRCRKLTLALAAAGTVLALEGIALVPAASADSCVVTLTLLGKPSMTYTVDVPTGTPLSSIPLPQGILPEQVLEETEVCASGSTTTTLYPTTTSTSSSSTSTSSTSTSTTSSSDSSSTGSSSPTSTSAGSSSPTSTSTGSSSSSSSPTSTSSTSSSSSQTAPGITGPGSSQRASSHRGGLKQAAKHGRHRHKQKPHRHKAAKRSKPKPGGTPRHPSSSAFSFTLPGEAPLAVPNFFIDSFQIPPFLLPIYQAAGTTYDVPWQVLAGINEIETDYGRNLSVSSAGAVGWMQFLPSTWKTWGIDANGDGIADPYNPVDAIFSAARYLHAAGASRNLSNAIFAYNHADWYVQSVLLRGRLISGIPDQLIEPLTGLVEGYFPVAAPSKYADDAVQALAKRHVKSANAAVPITSDTSTAVSIYAKQRAPVIAVNDGKIVKVGQNAKWGKFIQLQDQTGNVYTYAQLGSIPSEYPVPKPVKLTARQLAREVAAPVKLPAPTAPASAGSQRSAPVVSSAQAARETARQKITLPTTTTPARRPQLQTLATPLVKERLFANPSRPASFAAGGRIQLQAPTAEISNFDNYFSDVLHLAKNQYTLHPVKAGAIVVAGTILGRIASGTRKAPSHVQFMIQPAGKDAPPIDPKPILDGWKLLQATAVYRAGGADPWFGAGAANATVGEILLMSKAQLQNRVLQDRRVQIYSCGRRDVQAGLIDRRVLATIEFLAASGLDPTVSGLECGHALLASTSATDAAAATGSSVDVSAINDVPIAGHQGPGSITDVTIRRLLTLQGAMKPDEIISTMSYKGQGNTLALPDHADRIQIAFMPLFGTNAKLASAVDTILQPGQWAALINRVGQIPEPIVPIAPSKYAIRTAGTS